MSDMRRDVFVHFFNDQMHRNYGLHRRHRPEVLAQAGLVALKIAYLLTDSRLIVPMSDIVESDALRSVLPALRPVIDDGSVTFSGASERFEDLILRKSRQYERVRIYPRYFDTSQALGLEHATWTPRLRSSTSDVATGWEERIKALAEPSSVGERWGSAHQFVVLAWEASRGSVAKSQFIDEALSVQHRLGDDAFLWDIIRARNLLSVEASPRVDLPLRLALAQDWLMSYLTEYDAILLVDFPVLGLLDCGVQALHHDRTASIRHATRHLEALGLGRVAELDFWELQEVKAGATFDAVREHLWWPRVGFSVVEGRSQSLIGSLETDSRNVWSDAMRSVRLQFENLYQKLYDLDRLETARVDHLQLNVGSIVDTKGAIVVNAGGDKFKGSISINTGAISQSPGAINLGGEVKVWQSNLQAVQAASPELASILEDLRSAFGNADGLTGVERAEGVAIVEAIAAGVGSSGRDEAEVHALESKVSRLSEIAVKSGAAAGGLAALVEALRTTFGL